MRCSYYLSLLAIVAILCGTAVSEAYAQKGIGDDVGVARAAVKPEVITLSGKVVGVETGPCKNTTGRALVGSHVNLKTPEGETLNVHLGPAGAVESVAGRLTADTEIEVRAFRTDAMKENHFVAQSFRIGDETVTLRDETLRPAWAGSRGRGPRGGGYGDGFGNGWGAGGACPWLAANEGTPTRFQGCPYGGPQGQGRGNREFYGGRGNGRGYGAGAGGRSGRGGGYRGGGGMGRGAGWGGGR